MKLVNLASTTYDELGQTGLGIPFITSWYRNNIGRLNLEIDSDICVSGQNLELEPELTDDQAAIFKLLFNDYFYNRQARVNMGANGYSVQSVSEGDSNVRVVSKTDLAKQYQALAKENKILLDERMKIYRLNYAVAVETGN